VVVVVARTWREKAMVNGKRSSQVVEVKIS
jgi:hypothetical protein